MNYTLFIDKYIHPFIIYVVVGTLISYGLVRVASHLPLFRDARSRALVFGAPFVVPVIAYLVHTPRMISGCFIFGKPLGAISDLICNGGRALAVILTPLFTVVLVLAVTKAVLSIYASRRIVRKYGYAEPVDYMRLFSMVERLCYAGEVVMPRLIVTKDRFARSFTMGYWSPVIVLSEGLVEALDDDELETVIAHELGHISRADSLFTWFTVFLRDLMFFSPLVYWIFKDLAAEREKASDDIAIKLSNKPMAFAQALIKTWRLSSRSFLDNIMLDNFMPYPNFVGNTGVLESRVQRILDDEHMAKSHPLVPYAAAVVIVIAAVEILAWVC